MLLILQYVGEKSEMLALHIKFQCFYVIDNISQTYEGL